jgi:DNA-binding MarR family transcriptional regulator
MPKLDSRMTDPKGSESKSSESKSPDARNGAAGRFAYDGLDRVIHEKARLGVLTSLVAHPKGLVFGDLKQLCGLTDGNLSRHLQVLDEAGLIEIEKGYDHNRPQTICRITAQGRRRYLDYLKVLEQVVQDAASAAKAGSANLAPLGSRRLKLA